jgi:hypothetical protein
MRRFVVLITVLLAVASALTLGASAANATVGCTLAQNSDGHRFGVNCYRADSTSHHHFRFSVTACGPGGCTTLGSNWTAVGRWAWVNAGSGYIDQDSALAYFAA